MTATFIFINGICAKFNYISGEFRKITYYITKYVWQIPQEVKTIQLCRMRLEYVCKNLDSQWTYARAHQQTECHYSCIIP